MHGGPIERALLSPPGKSLQAVLPEGARSIQRVELRRERIRSPGAIGHLRLALL